MMKYSLVALATVAVIMSSGCDDSECCGADVAKPAPKPVENVKPVITRVLGLSPNTTVTCQPGSTKTLTSTGSDVNGNLDGTTYSYMVDNQPFTGTTIACPEAGETKKVCATVKDKEGLESDEVCVTLKGAEPVATACKITATDKGTEDEPVTNATPIVGVENSAVANSEKLIAGHTYSFKFEGCPTAQNCHWETLWSKDMKSDGDDDDAIKKCITNGEKDADASPHVSDDFNPSSADVEISVGTCGQDWDEIKIEVKCDNGAGVTSYFDLSNGQTVESNW